MLDDSLRLYHNDNLTASAAAVNDTTDTTEGTTNGRLLPQSFPTNKTFALWTSVQKAGGGGQVLTIKLQYSIATSPSWIDALTVVYPASGIGATGVQVQQFSREILTVDKIAGPLAVPTSNIRVRVTVTAPSSTSDWDRVYAYLTPCE